MLCLPEVKILKIMFIRFDRMYERDGQTDGQTDEQTPTTA